jgi:hypothetical protein
MEFQNIITLYKLSKLQNVYNIHTKAIQEDIESELCALFNNEVEVSREITKEDLFLSLLNRYYYSVYLDKEVESFLFKKLDLKNVVYYLSTTKLSTYQLSHILKKIKKNRTDKEYCNLLINYFNIVDYDYLHVVPFFNFLKEEDFDFVFKNLNDKAKKIIYFEPLYYLMRMNFYSSVETQKMVMHDIINNMEIFRFISFLSKKENIHCLEEVKKISFQNKAKKLVEKRSLIEKKHKVFLFRIFSIFASNDIEELGYLKFLLSKVSPSIPTQIKTLNIPKRSFSKERSIEVSNILYEKFKIKLDFKFYENDAYSIQRLTSTEKEKIFDLLDVFDFDLLSEEKISILINQSKTFEEALSLIELNINI